MLVAADLVSQAEHDELAASVLVTDSPELALSVAAEVERQAATTRHADRVRAALDRRAVRDRARRLDLATAAAFSNAYGPEHLEVQTAEPGEVLDLLDERRRHLPRARLRR